MEFVESFDLCGVDAKQNPSITGEGAPTATTKAAVGFFYMDKLDGKLYKCTAVSDGSYTWEEVASGVGNKAAEYQWSKIDEFTMEETAIVDKDYSSQNLEGIRVLISVPANTVSNVTNINTYVTTGKSGNIWCGYYIIKISEPTKGQNIICTTVKEYGLWTSNFSSSQDDYAIKRGTTSSNVDCTLSENQYLKKLVSQHSIPAGATITVYGLFPV